MMVTPLESSNIHTTNLDTILSVLQQFYRQYQSDPSILNIGHTASDDDDEALQTIASVKQNLSALAGVLSSLEAILKDPRSNVDALKPQITSTIPVETLLQVIHGLSSQSSKSINDEVEGVIGICCSSILPILLKDCSLSTVLEQYGPQVELGLQNSHPKIRLLYLSQFAKIFESDRSESVVPFVTSLINSNYGHLIIQCLDFENGEVLKEATEWMQNVSKVPSGVDLLLQDSVIAQFQTISQKSETTKFRVYEMFLNIAISSDENLTEFAQKGLIHLFLQELHTEDVLVKLNVIELLPLLAQSQNGWSMLEEAGTMQNLITVLANENDQDYFVRLTKCGVIKFVGKLALLKNIGFETMDRQYHLMNKLDLCLQSSDNDVKTTTISSLALLLSNPQIVEYVFPLSASEPHHLLQHLIEQYKRSMYPLKSQLLDTFTALFSIPKTFSSSSQNASTISTTCEKIYSFLSSPVQELLKHIHHPEPTFRISIFLFFKSLTFHTWGCKLLFENTVLNTLLDRTHETEYNLKLEKFKVVESLVTEFGDFERSGKIEKFGPVERVKMDRCQKFIREGPFYRDVEAAVAMESGR
ncbi:proteasome non-ATPase 26S subunit-domain-containing protein [Paraphysoderma sedebokerense]|nr:proteasome non-ATPase 26S subunit-domain-containing protein [Paraphysoderma sedebokerense]